MVSFPPTEMSTSIPEVRSVNLRIGTRAWGISCTSPLGICKRYHRDVCQTYPRNDVHAREPAVSCSALYAP